MPTVPQLVAPSVMPAPSTGLPYQSSAGATPEAFGAGIGRAEQGLGAQIEQTGDMLARHALKLQEDVNVGHAEELFLQGDTKLSALTEQYSSLQGADRVKALPKFMEDAAAIRNELKQQAPNGDVAKKFDQLFTRQLGYSIKDAGRLAGTATRQYLREQDHAIQANSLGKIASDTQDDQRFLTNVQQGLEAVRNGQEYKGAAPEVREQQDRAFVSSAWSTRLSVMAKNDPLRARELLKSNRDSIDGLTQVKLEDVINQGIINNQSRVEADRIIGSGALVDPTLAERVKKLEGYSDKPYNDFKQTSIGYGTKYQPGDENLSPTERKAVMEQRLVSELGRAANIVDTFAPGLPKGTRDAMISLTYNAGSAWTTQGLGQAIKAGDYDTAKQRFGQYIMAGGQENPGLVNRRATELGWWGGEPKETDSTTQMGKALDQAKETAIKTFPDDPANQAKYLDVLQNRIKSDFNVMQGQARDQQLQIRNVVQEELFNPDHHVTSYDKLSPKAQQYYDMAPPALQQSFQKAMRQNATADVPLTNERQSRYDTLYGESKNEPDKFMSRDISSEDLPRAQKSALLKMQADRKALLAKGEKLSSAMSALQPLLNDAGIGKSATDSAKNEEYNKFSGVLEQRLAQISDEKKRPPTDKEIRETGKELLKELVTSPGWLWDSKDRAYRVIADKTPITLRADDPQAHYASLPRGATFVGPDGQVRVKP